MKFYVEVCKKSDDMCVKQIGPLSRRDADRLWFGIAIDPESQYVWIVNENNRAKMVRS